MTPIVVKVVSLSQSVTCVVCNRSSLDFNFTNYYNSIKESRKTIVWAERLFNCWIDSLHENWSVTINFY